MQRPLEQRALVGAFDDVAGVHHRRARARTVSMRWLRQTKIGQHGSGARFFDGKEVERAGIVVIGGHCRRHEKPGQAADSGRSIKLLRSFAGPGEKEIGAAGCCREVTPRHAWKQRHGGYQFVAARRSILVHIGPGLQVAQLLSVELDVPALVENAPVGLFAEHHDTRLSYLRWADFLRHGGKFETASLRHTARQQERNNRQRHNTAKHRPPPNDTYIANNTATRLGCNVGKYLVDAWT